MLHGRSLEQATTHPWIENWMSVASVCLCYYDYLLCFEREIAYLWKARRSRIKYLYLLNRYLCLLEIPLSMLSIQSGISQKFCRIWCKEVLVIEIISAGTLGGILVLRTWMDWGHDRPLLLGLVAFGVICLVSKLGILIRVIVDSHASYTVDYSYKRRCGFLKKHSLLFAFHSMSSLMIIVAFVLGASRFPKRVPYRHWRQFLCAFLKDSLFYLFVIFAAAVVNVVLWLTPYSYFRNVFIFPFRVLGSIMGARILLHLATEILPEHCTRGHGQPRCSPKGDNIDCHDDDNCGNCDNCNGQRDNAGGFAMASRVSTVEFAPTNMSAFDVRTGPYSYEGGSPAASVPSGELDWRAACHQMSTPQYRTGNSYHPSSNMIGPPYMIVPDNAPDPPSDPGPSWIKDLHDPYATRAFFKMNRTRPKKIGSDGLSFDEDFEDDISTGAGLGSVADLGGGDILSDGDGERQRNAVQEMEADERTISNDAPVLKYPKPPDRNSLSELKLDDIA